MGKRSKKNTGFQSNSYETPLDTSVSIPSSAFSRSDSELLNPSSKSLHDHISTPKDIITDSRTSNQARVSPTLLHSDNKGGTEEKEPPQSFKNSSTSENRMNKSIQNTHSVSLPHSLDVKPLKDILNLNSNTESSSSTEKNIARVNSAEKFALESELLSSDSALKSKSIMDRSSTPLAERDLGQREFQNQKQKQEHSSIQNRTFISEPLNIPILLYSSTNYGTSPTTGHSTLSDTGDGFSKLQDIPLIENISPPFLSSEQDKIDLGDTSQDQLPGTWVGSSQKLNFIPIDNLMDKPKSVQGALDVSEMLTPTPSFNYLPSRPPPPPPTLPPTYSLPFPPFNQHSSDSRQNICGGYMLIQFQKQNKVACLLNKEYKRPFYKALWDSCSNKIE